MAVETLRIIYIVNRLLEIGTDFLGILDVPDGG